MAQNTYTVYDQGIYHGLPTYPSSIKSLNAIVTGANGISGQYMVRVLGQNPERWAKIYCLSRRPPDTGRKLPDNAEHISIDFMWDSERIAEVLKERGVTADYVFFYAYAHLAPTPGQNLWTNAQDLCEVNGAVLKNFLEALNLALITPKSVMLQTGAKSYSGHIGPSKIPMEEWDPRLDLEPNFYHTQEDLLWDYCKKNSVNWSVTMPQGILGAVPGAAMNWAFFYGAYASICKHLKEPLAFPGDYMAYQAAHAPGSAMLNAYFQEWTVLSGTPNERWNCTDDSTFSHASFWPLLAGWYGIPYVGPEEEGLTTIEWGAENPPRGYGPKGKTRYKFLFVDWAMRPEVQKAWKELATEHDLIYQEFRMIQPMFQFADWAINRADPIPMSKDKSRKRRWHGFVDSAESMLAVLDELVELKVIPKVPKVEVRFL